jgi:hypothetical protein
LFSGLAFFVCGDGGAGDSSYFVCSDQFVGCRSFWWRVVFFSPSCCFTLRGVFEYFSVSFGSFYYKNLRIIVASTFSLSASLSFSLLQSLRDSSVSACDDASPRKSSTTGAFFSFAVGRAMTCCILPILISQF